MDDDNDFDLDDIMGDSNAGAYQKTENRTGPPLEYVSEKIEFSLKSLHHLITCVQRETKGEFKDRLLYAAKESFRLNLVAFLALHNLLTIANDHKVLEQLLTRTPDEFDDWLEAVKSEGSITG